MSSEPSAKPITVGRSTRGMYQRGCDKGRNIERITFELITCCHVRMRAAEGGDAEAIPYTCCVLEKEKFIGRHPMLRVEVAKNVDEV